MRSLLHPLSLLAVLAGSADALRPGGAQVAGAKVTAGDVAEVLDRHARWLGGRENFGKVEDFVATGKLTSHGLSGTIRSEGTRDGWTRNDVDLGVLTEREVIGPTEAFTVNANGQVEPKPEESAARARFNGMRDFGLHLLPGNGFKAELRAREDKDGRTWDVVRVERGGLWCDLLLDPADGRHGWTRERRDREDVWTRHTDWRLVEGLRISFRTEVLRDEPRENVTVEWREIQLNAGIDRRRFDRPASRADVVRFSGGSTATGWIPMELHLGRYIYLKGKVNGRETDIVLDSGAGATVIDAGLADELKLESVGEVAARGVGGVQSAAVLDNVTLELPGLLLPRIKAARIDMGGVGRMLGRPMPVVLGKEMFHAMVVDIDYPSSRIAFRAAEGFDYRGDGRKVPLFPGPDGHRRVDVVVDGKATARVTVDTGSGGTVALFKAFTEENRLLEGRTVSETQGGGVGGAIVSKVATLDSLTFAGYELKAVPASFTRSEKSTFDSREFDGNLGAGVFSRFRLIFDYAREALWVEPGAEWDKQPFRRDRVGIQGRFDDGALLVSFVAPGSPAEKGGVQPGERITRLGDKPLTADNWRVELMNWSNAPAGSEVKFTGAGGEERTLRAVDYF